MSFCMETFAGNVRAERNRRRWTREELASQSGVSTSTISSYEDMRNVPSIENAAKLADVFGVTLDELVGREV